jgi:hypothetical protein
MTEILTVVLLFGLLLILILLPILVNQIFEDAF